MALELVSREENKEFSAEIKEIKSGAVLPSAGVFLARVTAVTVYNTIKPDYKEGKVHRIYEALLTFNYIDKNKPDEAPPEALYAREQITMDGRGNLIKYGQAILGDQFKLPFLAKHLLGKECEITVIHSVNGNYSTAKISNISKVTNGKAPEFKDIEQAYNDFCCDSAIEESKRKPYDPEKDYKGLTLITEKIILSNAISPVTGVTYQTLTARAIEREEKRLQDEARAKAEKASQSASASASTKKEAA